MADMASLQQIKRIKALNDGLNLSKETAIDGNLREYPNDSFDRFGDDLCELIVSYLSIECKLRFECISKQWNRLLANRQKKLIIRIKTQNRRHVVFEDMDVIEVLGKISVEWIRRVLNKFRFITDLDINIIDIKVLNEVIDNCNQLKRLQIIINPFIEWVGLDVSEGWIKIFEKIVEKFGQTLKELSIDEISDSVMTDELLINLSKLQKLTAIRVNNSSFNFQKISDSSVGKLVENCRKLNKISISYKLNDMKIIEILSERAKSNPKIEFKFDFSVESVVKYKAKAKSLKIADNLKICLIEVFDDYYDYYSDSSDDFYFWTTT